MSTVRHDQFLSVQLSKAIMTYRSLVNAPALTAARTGRRDKSHFITKGVYRMVDVEKDVQSVLSEHMSNCSTPSAAVLL